MSFPTNNKWTSTETKRYVLCYGLALASVGAAFALARVFLYFHLPQPFTSFAMSAIAITFWYGGAAPGILAAVLSILIRTYLFQENITLLGRLGYSVAFIVFAFLMIGVRRRRSDLEVKVAGRTAELTRANEELSLEIAERKRAEDKVRQSEAYLAEAQKLTHTGSWVWEVGGKRALHLSEEWYRVYGFDPSDGLEAWRRRLERIHPNDRARRQETIDQAINSKSEYDIEYRIVLPNGAIKHVHSVGHPILDGSGNLMQFVGSSTDITDRRLAEEALREAQSDLAHISRVTTMGELTASLAHEVNQPIAAAMTDANTCLRWLNRDEPNVAEAREAASRVVKDATRAAEIISRTRLLFKKGTPQSELVNMNDIIREMLVLMVGDMSRLSIAVRMELADDLPQIAGDRVQLQQVLMNLMANSVDAMKDTDGTRELAINSQRGQNAQLMVTISDTGVGLPPQQADQIFNAFFTTKPNGTGMGLRISRSIIESHGGRLWASDRLPRGANFYITLPIEPPANE